jgi:hypothetical protein
MRMHGLGIVAVLGLAIAGTAIADARKVTVDDFKRAESDLYFAKFVKDGAFGKFVHARQPVAIEKQDVIRMNRDTLYSSAVVDLAAGPATVTIPDAGGRFLAVQVISEDHYTPAVVYAPGPHTFTQADVGTRYALFLVRTFVDPRSESDLAAVHALQDALQLELAAPGRFEVPAWDQAEAAKLRDALNAVVAVSGIESAKMFGREDEVDPVHHLLGTASGWGGNPASVAVYQGVTPERNDGETVYRLTAKDVPVDAFWSISVYGRDGFFEKNAQDAYSINDVTAKRGADGSITVQFGGCDTDAENCLPITPGWNYLVRMYRPRQEILDGSWRFPEAVAVP